jgi:phosphatidylserine/phosphatidylglycerophosphate/cardiolipin synthase-like enzyme
MEEYSKFVFRKVLAGKQLTNSLRDELNDLIKYCNGNPHLLTELRQRLLKMAADKMTDSSPAMILSQVEEVSKIIDRELVECFPSLVEVHFNPGEECLLGILRLFTHVKQFIDICVFTITDDRIAGAILQAHKRGKVIRIITDDEKMHAPGSDIIEIANADIPVAIDHAPEHMHHKFAIFDRRILLSGSFNWTRSASLGNHENLLITDDPRLVKPFDKEFERLWKKFPKLQLG